MPTFSATALGRVIHLVYPGVKLLDVAGPLQVFHDARAAGGERAYETVLASHSGGSITTDVGVALETLATVRLRVRPTDIVIVPGGHGVFAAADNDSLVRWLRERAPRARLIASTCTGAFLLAAASLLDGRRAVTHWDDCDDLQRKHPAIEVDADPIFVRDGAVWTSAGVTTGIDLSLAIVEDDLGRPSALDLARRLIVYSKRTGGQSQFSHRLQQQVASSQPQFERLHRWVEEHLDGDLRVEKLASCIGMSPRTFHRAYTKETGITPARMVTRSRLEAARRLLEESDLGVATIAARCGFGTEEHMRRTFRRDLAVSPSGYRETWGAAAIASIAT